MKSPILQMVLRYRMETRMEKTRNIRQRVILEMVVLAAALDESLLLLEA